MDEAFKATQAAIDAVSGLTAQDTVLFLVSGGYVDGATRDRLRAQGLTIFDVLQQNDSYHALERCDGLVKTGAKGTNVNDLSVVLIRR